MKISEWAKLIISRTPYRISFFGGGTDYPAWYRDHGGAVLATTIDKYCYLSVRELPPFFAHRYRVVYSIVENVKVDTASTSTVNVVLQTGAVDGQDNPRRLWRLARL